MTSRVLIGMLLPLLVAGCAVGPDHERPATQAPLPRQWTAEAPDDALAASLDGTDHWWEAFGDPQLNELVTESLAQAFELSNEYAPEHLGLLVKEPWTHLGSVRNAGGVFLGERSFEVLGDYVAGPSHTMPTGGTARFASPINVNDFVKIVSVIGLTEQALQAIGPAAELLAQTEGLTAHAAAVTQRLG